jgi:hypothetical protein
MEQIGADEVLHTGADMEVTLNIALSTRSQEDF